MHIKGKIIIWTPLIVVIYIQFICSNWFLLILPLMIKWHILFNHPTGFFIRNYNISLIISSGDCAVSITHNTMLNCPPHVLFWSVIPSTETGGRFSQKRMKIFTGDSKCSLSFKSSNDVGSHMTGGWGRISSIILISQAQITNAFSTKIS